MNETEQVNHRFAASLIHGNVGEWHYEVNKYFKGVRLGVRGTATSRESALGSITGIMDYPENFRWS